MRRLTMLLLVLLATQSWAAPPAIFKLETQAPVEKTYQALYQALEAQRFWVVFEADMLASTARFKESWGADYNPAGLDALRALVVCNGWWAHKVSGADPDLVGLCPLRVGLQSKGGVTSVLFVRPTVAAQGSPGLPVVEQVEALVIEALKAGVAAAER